MFEIPPICLPMIFLKFPSWSQSKGSSRSIMITKLLEQWLRMAWPGYGQHEHEPCDMNEKPWTIKYYSSIHRGKIWLDNYLIFVGLAIRFLGLVLV